MTALHRIHAEPSATRVKIADMDWRAEGRAPLSLKQEIAYRIAVCWNVCSGFPVAALLDNVLGELCDAVHAGDLERAQAALKRMDKSMDLTGGRDHDCAPCLAGAGEP